MIRKALGMAAALTLALAGCDENPTSPDGSGVPLSLSVMVPAGGPAPAARMFAGEITIDDGAHVLVIESAEVVLGEIEFELAEGLTGCGEDEGKIEGSEDDDCEEIEAGPLLLPLPLDGTNSEEVLVSIPPGTYDEIEYDIHRLDDDPADLAFLAEPGHEGLDGVSVRVTGRWDGVPFTYTTDLDVEVEMDLGMMEITAGTDYNVTLLVDVESWFYDGIALTNPNEALVGQQYEELVESRIEASIEGFEDNDHDGVPHEEDDDEDGS